MALGGLEQMLEYPDRAPFYDLLGGLSDNLLTIGRHAGTFLACDACGDTFTLKDESWECECCGQAFELKFKPAKNPGSPFESTVRVSGLTKSRLNPHWYYENENWSVAEFLTQLLRLRPEDFLAAWFLHLGVELGSPDLETMLCWPRFRFGGKTIQPDFAVGFQRDVVLVEFKRPAGGTVPPIEIMGQLCFAAEAERQLGRRWHVVLVPGRDSKTRTSTEYVRDALAAALEAQAKWAIPQGALEDIQAAPQSELAGRLCVHGWESLLRLSSEAIRAAVPESWTRQQTLIKLLHFHQRRAEIGLLSPPVSI